MYCTVDDLKLAIPERTLIELSNDESTASSIDPLVLSTAINQASELVDGYLRGRYRLPLNPIPTIVKHLVIDIARYWLYSRRPEGLELPNTVTLSHRSALSLLTEVRDGQVTLGINSGEALSEPGEFRVSKRKRQFDGTFLEQY